VRNHAIRPTPAGNEPVCGATDGTMDLGGVTCTDCLAVLNPTPPVGNELNIWGTPIADVDADEFCPWCEHSLYAQSDGTSHYEGCTRPRLATTVRFHIA
jgi:hypothetical protein